MNCDEFSIYFLLAGTTETPLPTATPQVTQFYQEVWFIALVLVVSLVLLFLGIVLCMRYSGRNIPYIRERAPLQPRHKRMPFGMNYCIDPYNGSIIAAVSISLLLFCQF
jgi:usherin